MSSKTLFEQFDEKGELRLPAKTIPFHDIVWNRHPDFDGVEVKNIVSGNETGGKFSYHLVRIAPEKTIGNHIHTLQVETHEVISGTGRCVNNGRELAYETGVISIFPTGAPHEVSAGPHGLCLFAKFIPALV